MSPLFPQVQITVSHGTENQTANFLFPLSLLLLISSLCSHVDYYLLHSQHGFVSYFISFFFFPFFCIFLFGFFSVHSSELLNLLLTQFYNHYFPQYSIIPISIIPLFLFLLLSLLISVTGGAKKIFEGSQAAVSLCP